MSSATKLAVLHVSCITPYNLCKLTLLRQVDTKHLFVKLKAAHVTHQQPLFPAAMISVCAAQLPSQCHKVERRPVKSNGETKLTRFDRSKDEGIGGDEYLHILMSQL
jgi:hypothetical protein